MRKLWELRESDQDFIIKNMLSEYGDVVGRFSSPYSYIYTIKPTHSSQYLIAKAPKFLGDMSKNDVLALAKNACRDKWYSQDVHAFICAQVWKN